MSTQTLHAQTAVATQQRHIITGSHKPYTLETVTEAIPEPAPGYVRVQVQTAGVAYADVMVRNGMYPGAPKNPMTPGYDVVGVVDALGAGVTGLTIGQQVAAMPKFGCFAQFVCVKAEQAVPVPAGLDPVEAVSIVLNYLTAYRMLHSAANAQKGERLLVHSAAGGVGTALLQLGQIAGLEMYGTASKGKHDIVAAYGATPIDYKNEDFAARINALTNGGGVDIVCDPVGGDTMIKSYKLLRPGGRLVSFGFLDAMGKGITAVVSSLVRLYLYKLKPDGRQISMFGSTPTIADKENGWYRETLTNLFAMLKEGQIEPVIGKTLPLSDASEALDLLENGRVQGKIVLINEQ